MFSLSISWDAIIEPFFADIILNNKNQNVRQISVNTFKCLDDFQASFSLKYNIVQITWFQNVQKFKFLIIRGRFGIYAVAEQLFDVFEWPNIYQIEEREWKNSKRSHHQKNHILRPCHAVKKCLSFLHTIKIPWHWTDWSFMHSSILYDLWMKMSKTFSTTS